MSPVILEWIGYLASFLIAVSLATKSIIRLRWINLAGSIVFFIYGYFIGSWPVFVANLFITIVNIYYLVQIYTKKIKIEIVPVNIEDQFLTRFINFYKKDILKFHPNFESKNLSNSNSYIIMRNANIAGVFSYDEVQNSTSEILIDYVLEEYRDFKNGEFIYEKLKPVFKEKGIKSLIIHFPGKKHFKYLKKMNFIRTNENEFCKYI